VLRLNPSNVDVHRFRALVRQARCCAVDADKVGLLRRALRLWRGPVLAGAGVPEVADLLTRGLTEDWFAAEEECVAAELRTGSHLAVLGRLADLVAQHPHRQRFVAQLMLAQYRAGRQADALATYRAARAALVRDLGLDPERRLRDLAGAIVRGDPGLDLPEATGR
jgi:ABC-2 type transport system ATP-binding protein